MHALLDYFAVGAILLGSVGYALSALGPRALRARILAGAAAALRKLPGCLRLGGFAQRVLAAKPQGACGGCQGCEPSPGAASSAPTATAAAEIHIPVARIGKR